ncbi:TonB-dependent receptor [Robiginitalea sp. IMCC43444]|uniref:TonB-dependent receptor n=1 Tax=Robiginitalea sp. IMCC43444 TaxID=3459121 RepID=UPI0040413236
MRYFHRPGLLIVILFLLTVFKLSAQKIYIYERETGSPISDVAVFNEDRSTFAISDFDGACNISAFDSGERLYFRHLSHEPFVIRKSTLLKQGGRVYLYPKPEQLQEVVMSISKWEQQKREIPQKIVSIDAGSIAFANPQTSADLLQQSGKIFVQKSQYGGGSPTIRGFATNRVLLSVDGVRMNNAIFRGGNLQNVISIDPFNVKNTEVIFGPGSVIYGSDAIGGVMNFYTRTPLFSRTDSLEVSANAVYRLATASNEQTLHGDVEFSQEKWAFLSSFSFNSYGDLRMGSHGPDSYLRPGFIVRRDGEDQLVTNSDPEKQVPSGFDLYSFMQKIRFKPNNSWSFDLGLHYSETSDYARYDRLIRPADNEAGLRSAEWFYGPQKWFMGNLQVYQQGRNTFYDGLKITTAYQFFEESRNERAFRDEIRYSNRERLGAFSLNLDFENKKIGDLSLFYGTEFIYNQVNSVGRQENILSGQRSDYPSRYPDGSRWQSLAGYVNAAYKFRPNWTLLSGLRYSHVWINAEFDDRVFSFPFDSANLDNGALTASLGLSWFPNENTQITLNGSTGFRAPNIDDIGKIFDSEPGSVVVPNPDLEPEYAYNAEIGIRQNIAEKLVLKGAAYYTYLVDALVRRDFVFDGQNTIVYNGEPSNVQAIQNAAKAYVYGYELGFDARLREFLSLSGNLTFTEGTEEEDDGSDSPARHVPPTFGDLQLQWNKYPWKAAVVFNYNGEIPYEDLAFSERSKAFIYARDVNGNPFSPSWYTLNLRTSYKFSERYELGFSVENITDQRYRPYSSGITGSGINFIGSIRARFN